MTVFWYWIGGYRVHGRHVAIDEIAVVPQFVVGSSPFVAPGVLYGALDADVFIQHICWLAIMCSRTYGHHFGGCLSMDIVSYREYD
jgi:hypothetical protein